MADIQLIALSTIWHNLAGRVVMTDIVDPQTGEFRLKAVPQIAAPGTWVSLPESDARKLIEIGAAREPEESELALWRMAHGPTAED